MPRVSKRAPRARREYTDGELHHLMTGWDFCGGGFGNYTRMMPGPARDAEKERILGELRDAWQAEAVREAVWAMAAERGPDRVPWASRCWGDN